MASKPKPTKAVIEKRVEEILRLRLDGAEIWDIREYVREKEQEEGSAWHLPEGEKPLSDSQLWRYQGRVDKLIAESCRASRKKLLRRHLAQRRSLYAKATISGDYRTALSILRDEAELLNLYPARRTELTGKEGGAVILNITEEIIDHHKPTAPGIENIIEEVVTHADSGNAGQDNPPASHTEGVPLQ